MRVASFDERVLSVIVGQMYGAADCCSIHAMYSLICLDFVWPFFNEVDGILSLHNESFKVVQLNKKIL